MSATRSPSIPRGAALLRDPAKPRPTDVLADVRAQTYLPEYRLSA